MTRRSRLLPSLALLGGLLVSVIATAELGGARGVRFTYQGRLESGPSPVDGPVDLTFNLYGSQGATIACDTHTETGVRPANGVFSVEIGPFDEACVTDEDVWLGVEVAGTELGRQRLTPVFAAYTAGPGADFEVAESLRAGTINVERNATLRGGATVTGPVSITGGSPPLDVKGLLKTVELDAEEVAAGAMTAGTVSATGVTTGTLTVNDTLTLGNTVDLNVGGTVTWKCPAGTSRVGAQCISTSQGVAGSVGSAHEACHDLGMSLCSLESIVLCDQLNQPAGGTQCGAVTDQAYNAAFPSANWILTATPVDGNHVSAFAHSRCFAHRVNPFTTAVENVTFDCAEANHFYCCVPISPNLD